MSNKMMWVLVVVAFLVGAYAGYAYEKAKFVKLMAAQFQDMQRQIDDAKNPTQKSTVENKDVVVMTDSDILGAYATDANGMALYIYDKDSEGKSNCVDACATNWPPYMATGDVTVLPERVGTIQRADGSMQYTWDGKPLYYYANDKTKDDVTGDEVGGVWHLIK